MFKVICHRNVDEFTIVGYTDIGCEIEVSSGARE